MKTHQSYFILASNRSGGTLLCELLRNTKVAGHISEHFLHKYGGSYRQWDISDYPTYVRNVVGDASTSNGVYGVRVLAGEYGSIECLVRRLQQFPQYAEMSLSEVVHAFFPNPKFIFLTRRNKVAQAVSWAKASQTRMYHSTQGAVLAAQTAVSHNAVSIPDIMLTPTYSFEEINEFIQSIIMQEAAHQDLLNRMDVTPYTIVYEDYIQNMAKTVNNILAFLDIPVTKVDEYPQPMIKKLADSVSAEWVQNYREELQQDWSYARW